MNYMNYMKLCSKCSTAWGDNYDDCPSCGKVRALKLRPFHCDRRKNEDAKAWVVLTAFCMGVGVTVIFGLLYPTM